jgi:hypothetical protein
MMHDRHYTVPQANAAIDWVRERIDRMRAARHQLGDEEAREALSQAAPGNGGGRPGVVVSEAFIDLRDALGELHGVDVVLRDLDRGLIDFPALRDGREVYLCLEDGEDEVEFWHDLETGFGGREPI